MSRFAFNAICTVLTAALMAAFGYFLSRMSTEFLEGMSLGTFGTLLTLMGAHKLGVRIF